MKTCKGLGTKSNCTILRSLYYPAPVTFFFFFFSFLYLYVLLIFMIIFFSFLFFYQDPQYFVKTCKGLGTKSNCTILRSLYYPAPVTVKQNQIRCGEHTDYGSITLLFQDKQGGLEVSVDVVPFSLNHFNTQRTRLTEPGRFRTWNFGHFHVIFL